MKIDGKSDDKFSALIQQTARIAEVRPGTIKGGHKGDAGGLFGDVLARELTRVRGLTVSAHAERRLKERNVVLEAEDMQKIEGAVQKAADKGSMESLVLYGDIALVASVRNRTIITAMDGKDMEEHIFTNIDSAVIVR